MATRSYIGKGSISVKQYGAAAGFMRIGNCSKLDLNFEEDVKDQLDYENAGGGLADTLSRIKNVTADLSAYSFSADNIALATRGTASAITSDTVTDEPHDAYLGATVPFDHLPNLGSTITVKDSAGTTTYDVVDDYILTRAGIIITEGSSIGDGDAIKVTYTKLVADEIELLTSSASEYAILFDGLNEANSGKAVVITLYRNKFSPTSKLSAIGDDFGQIDLTAKVLKDPTITGSGLSQFAKIQMAA